MISTENPIWWKQLGLTLLIDSWPAVCRLMQPFHFVHVSLASPASHLNQSGETCSSADRQFRKLHLLSPALLVYRMSTNLRSIRVSFMLCRVSVSQEFVFIYMCAGLLSLWRALDIRKVSTADYFDISVLQKRYLKDTFK